MVLLYSLDSLDWLLESLDANELALLMELDACEEAKLRAEDVSLDRLDSEELVALSAALEEAALDAALLDALDSTALDVAEEKFELDSEEKLDSDEEDELDSNEDASEELDRLLRSELTCEEYAEDDAEELPIEEL